MAKDIRQMFNDMNEGIAQAQSESPETVGAFFNLLNVSEHNGPLDVKTKELIALAVSVYCRCEYCIIGHCRSAYEAGATRAEILDAATTVIAYGGGPSFAYISATLMAALDEFEHEFE